MTKITIKVKKPTVKMTESSLYGATRQIRMNGTELGIIPADEGFMNVEFKSRSKDRAWDAYHDFRKIYKQKIFTCDVNTGKKSVQIFNR